MTKLLRFLSWPVLCGVLVAVIILDRFPVNGQHGSASPQQTPDEQPTRSYAPAVQRAAPAVVNIYTSKTVKPTLPDDPFFRHFLSRNHMLPKERIERSLGSGVIIDERGYLLTNNHVISGADEILVLLQDGREAIAKVIGFDKESDLAVLKIALENLDTIPVGDPSQTMVGDVVLAIGNPYGFGQTVTQGIISATGRYGLQLSTYENFIQTDAAINPGNSGGALVDSQGRLLGINTAIYTRTGGSQGIGLAIPSTLALRIMDDLIQFGSVIRGWLGVEVKPVPQAQAKANQLSGRNGVVITATAPGGPADTAGLKVGDIIVTINGQEVGDGHAGMNLVAATRPGEDIELDMIRDQQNMKLVARVSNRPEAPPGNGHSNQQAQN